MNSIKPIRRLLRKPLKYAQAVIRWKRFSFNETPHMFGNSKPKSGSHLLVQILSGFTQIMPFQYVAADPIRTITKDGRRRTEEEILTDLRRTPAGVIGWGYIDPTPENLTFLCQPGNINYFIYRDPRDMLVSQVFYATDMQLQHGMHEYYRSLPDFSARLKVAITGIDQDGMHMVSVKERYEGVFAWLAQPRVQCLRFEDLINRRDETLNSMLNEFDKAGYSLPVSRSRALEVLVSAIQPKKSHTFRSGQTGRWSEHFSEAHKRLFKDVAGDLLVRLGYERNNDW